MQLYFIRHAQSTNNALWDQTGSGKGRDPDPEITDTGREQAQCLAQFLRTHSTPPAGDNRFHYHQLNLTHLYSSPMIRAILTGQYIANELGLPLTIWTELCELGGIYQDNEAGEQVGLPGFSRAYLEARFPDLIFPADFPENGWWNRPYETKEAYPGRARGFIQELLARHGQSEDRVAVISHAGFGQALLSQLLNFSRQSEHLGNPYRFWVGINNTSIMRIDFHGERIGLAYINRVDFLPPELIT